MDINKNPEEKDVFEIKLGDQMHQVTTKLNGCPLLRLRYQVYSKLSRNFGLSVNNQF